VANGIVLWFMVYKLYGEPVKELLAATGAVSAGDYKYKVNIGENHELSNLAMSFNTMIDKISETQNQLYHNAKLASLGQIAAGIAHEINNPLTGVLTYSSYHLKRVESDNLDKKELKESLEVIVRETKRCREIIKGLLDFARQVPPKKTKNNINLVIEQALLILENQLTVNNITVDKFFLDEIPDIEADFVQLQQVFINLITNAAHAIGEKGGGIVIFTHLKSINGSEYVEVKISDTGHGIPDDKIGSIFDPFFSTKGQEGTGLGLSVVLGIIDEHNGKIDVESEVGKGTTFTIKLPV
jgi:two-component system NtrC family sensor kinase